MGEEKGFECCKPTPPLSLFSLLSPPRPSFRSKRPPPPTAGEMETGGVDDADEVVEEMDVYENPPVRTVDSLPPFLNSPAGDTTPPPHSPHSP